MDREGPISYLFGTMHVKDKRAFHFAELAKSKISACDQFFTEINFKDTADGRIFQAQKFPPGKNLETLLGDRKFQKTRKIILKCFGQDLNHSKEILPMVLVNQFISMKLAQDEVNPLDLDLHLFAQAQNIRTGGLETLEEHIAVLQNLSLEDQKAQLLSLARQPEKIIRMAYKLADLYAQGDIQGLYKYSKKSMGKMRSSIIYQRNYIMQERILAQLDKPSFFAVGAGHLTGKFGLLKLLKDKSIKCQPIQIPSV